MSSVARSGVPAVQYACARWTASGDFRRVEEWWRYLDAFAERVTNPIRLTLTRNGPPLATRRYPLRDAVDVGWRSSHQRQEQRRKLKR